MSNALYNTKLSFDDQTSMTIAAGEMKQHLIKAGSQTLDLLVSLTETRHYTYQINVSSQSVYYYKIDTSLRLAPTEKYAPYIRTFALKPVEPETAIPEIIACCQTNRQTNKTSTLTGTNKNTPSTDEKNNEAVFSTDKTHNPFSH